MTIIFTAVTTQIFSEFVDYRLAAYGFLPCVRGGRLVAHKAPSDMVW